jgi:hypothetical protein
MFRSVMFHTSATSGHSNVVRTRRAGVEPRH